MSIASEIQRLQTAKEDIRTNLNNLGFNVPSATSISSFANYVQKQHVPLSASARTDNDDVVIDIATSNDIISVICDFDNMLYAANITDGKAQLVFPDIGGGIHTATVYSNDSFYEMDPVSTSVTISGLPFEFDVQLYGSNVVAVYMPVDSTSAVTLEVSGTNYIDTEYVNANATAIFVLNGVSSGEKTVKVTYSGDDKYASGSTTETIIIPQV